MTHLQKQICQLYKDHAETPYINPGCKLKEWVR